MSVDPLRSSSSKRFQLNLGLFEQRLKHSLYSLIGMLFEQLGDRVVGGKRNVVDKRAHDSIGVWMRLSQTSCLESLLNTPEQFFGHIDR